MAEAWIFCDEGGRVGARWTDSPPEAGSFPPVSTGSVWLGSLTAKFSRILRIAVLGAQGGWFLPESPAHGPPPRRQAPCPAASGPPPPPSPPPPRAVAYSARGAILWACAWPL